ncbi:SMI1/KNR4 family protein [Flavobacterium sp. 20NA77.7]|uniref:SMI1/KNR4 family protein n=1 Tax=Flavobacterium nakdongensis TaxID=3073563 RepID=A0ABY9R6M9_9FLAO|nr:SMI1/KNR4 family protein [Flavobacterium sp. 20NA77.7]WMW76927.1 SMI1/KNR4 family protein [Flavobacterium sp. 20NA77.7]
MNKVDNILERLYKFSPNILQLGKAIADDRLEILQSNISINLPNDFVYLLKKHNGIFLCGVEILGLGMDFGKSSLDKVYQFEHFEVNNPMPLEYFPFSPDGMGNHYCLDLSKKEGNDSCPIVFWQWDVDYQLNEVETCNSDFLDWMEEVLIGWTENDYNYDGSEK